MGKTHLTDRAYNEIKDWIIHYKLKPGVQLNIAELATSLAMSQTPVREALSRLEHLRLVDHSQKGYLVRTLDLEEVSDMFEIRIALEVLAVKEAATRMKEADRKKLSHILEEAAIVIRNGERRKILGFEQEFHGSIMWASGNWLLTNMMRDIFDRIFMILNINVLTSDHLAFAHKEHMEIYKALENGDSHKSALLMKKHLEFGKKVLLLRLQDSKDVLAHLINAPREPQKNED